MDEKPEATFASELHHSFLHLIFSMHTKIPVKALLSEGSARFAWDICSKGKSKLLIRGGVTSIYKNRAGIFSVQDVHFKPAEMFLSFTFGEVQLTKKTWQEKGTPRYIAEKVNTRIILQSKQTHSLTTAARWIGIPVGRENWANYTLT